ncbi:uncharacterized protein LOC123565929 [Mercenaria mercenaria]|uniref:uncharacterized protein LOC123565929 n=1 Tax=Mercenaria mercenaria TaxID=6596 RepID=UPI00234FB334|nr:uncharacterized protein LOC123565929 [Mercenaria mercenaria]
MHQLCSCQNETRLLLNTVTNCSNTCPLSEILYNIYSQRLLLLSSDVELNPGPTAETQQSLDAISSSNMIISPHIEQVKHEILAVRADMAEVKNEVAYIKSKVSGVELEQRNMKCKLQEIDSQMDTLTYKSEIVDGDVRELAINFEMKLEQIDDIQRQMHYLDKENRKNNLRVFGLNESDDETPESSKTKIENELLKVAYPDDDNMFSSILYARSLGSFDGDQPRMVLIKFATFDIKFKLFSVRNKLRANEIRISNDLTNYERGKLNELKRQGKKGYFLNGKLNILPERQEHTEIKTRVYRKAGRRVERNSNTVELDVSTENVMENVSSENVTTYVPPPDVE